jgi:hypothetical protein
MSYTAWIFILFAAATAVAFLCRAGETNARWDRAEDEFLRRDEQTRRIIETVRRQQHRVRSRNRHLIVGQESRRKGSLAAMDSLDAADSVFHGGN